MKKILLFIAGLLLAVGLTSSAWADDEKAEGMMMGDHAKMMGMHRGMMMRQAGPSVVATSDGGVVVLSGCTLTKYDKNLKEVKEVQLPCGMKPKGGCPMMGAGKMGMRDMDQDDDDDDDKAAPATGADHASHH